MKTKWGVWGSGGIARRRTIPEGIARATNAELTHVYCRTTDVNQEIAATFASADAPEGFHREQHPAQRLVDGRGDPFRRPRHPYTSKYRWRMKECLVRR